MWVYTYLTSWACLHALVWNGVILLCILQLKTLLVSTNLYFDPVLHCTVLRASALLIQVHTVYMTAVNDHDQVQVQCINYTNFCVLNAWASIVNEGLHYRLQLCVLRDEAMLQEANMILYMPLL